MSTTKCPLCGSEPKPARDKQYNHMYTLAFEVISNHPKGDDVSPEMFSSALVQRIRDLDRHNLWDQALGNPDDTYEMDPEAWEAPERPGLWRNA